MIENQEQLEIAKKKLKDLGFLFIEFFETFEDKEVKIDVDPVAFNAMLGGVLRRMNLIHSDIDSFLAKK